MHWFYDPLLADSVTLADIGVLVGAEGQHATGSLRIRPGELIVITNGRGLVVEAEALEIGRGELTYRPKTKRVETAISPEIWLFQALAKGDRDELAIQAATELGVSGVVAWQAARSVARWEGPKISKGIARWRLICSEAAKQSHRSWFPEIADDLVFGLPANLPGLTLVLEPTADTKLTEVAVAGLPRVNLIVGPEGGFDAQELDRARQAGYQLVRLGSEILRTSSAGPAAIASIHTLSGRW